MLLPITVSVESPQLDAVAAGIARLEEKMSQLSDALKTLTDTDTALKTEVQTVVTFLAEHAAALDAAVTSGDLAAVQAVNDDLRAEITVLAGALPAPAPAPEPAPASAG